MSASLDAGDVPQRGDPGREVGRFLGKIRIEKRDTRRDNKDHQQPKQTHAGTAKAARHPIALGSFQSRVDTFSKGIELNV